MQLIDTELAGYHVVDEIGRGGMAVVYRAHQPRLERWVAIKVLRPDLLTVKEILARFRREAKAVAALRHPNILTIYDYGEERGLAYIVMEYVKGDTLRDRLHGKAWAWPEAVSLVIPVGQALAYAHSRGIIHRDVKPANILLPRDDWPLLSDFGLAKLLEAGQNLTQPGVGLGTALYGAPEQMMGEAIDHRADIYALGMTLYEMVTGRLPFAGDTPIDLMLKRLSQPPTPAREINSAVSPRLEEILMQSLARERDDRFGEMDQLVTALERVWRTALQGGTPDDQRTTQVIQRESASPGPRLSIAGTGVLLPLSSEKETTIGRETPTSAQVPDIDLSQYGGGQAGVSRLHARITHVDGAWHLEDLHSTNGTTVNGRLLARGQTVSLKDGDLIQFGSLSATFFGS